MSSHREEQEETVDQLNPVEREDFDQYEHIIDSVVTEDRYTDIAWYEGAPDKFEELSAYEKAQYAIRILNGEYADMEGGDQVVENASYNVDRDGWMLENDTDYTLNILFERLRQLEGEVEHDSDEYAEQQGTPSNVHDLEEHFEVEAPELTGSATFSRTGGANIWTELGQRHVTATLEDEDGEERQVFGTTAIDPDAKIGLEREFQDW